MYYYKSKNFSESLLSLILMSWVMVVSVLISMLLGSLLVWSTFSLSGIYFIKDFWFLYVTTMMEKHSLSFSLGVISISILVFIWARFYMKESGSLMFFFVLLFMFVLSMVILISSKTFFLLFIGWEGLGITSFLLIIFYQNWMSMGGGILTLLTNRIGDALLLISFSYWGLSLPSLELVFSISSSLFLIILILTFTKSAQVPFTSWLPAAMAAPTPVSALVHSSTLVTAGIWLMIQFGQILLMSSLFWTVFGIMTLLVASSSALVETDAKKVVALSTLSQLGLMYLSLSLGGKFICLFHLLMHAFAKANLFLMVGNLIHSRFSQQDIRFMSSGKDDLLIMTMIFISVISLSGMIFTSGFYSKDFILISHYFLMGSVLSVFIIISVVSLTLTYCVKLSTLLFKLSESKTVSTLTSSGSYITPSLFMSGMSVILGFIYAMNMNLFSMKLSSLSGLYWSYLLALPFLLSISLTQKWGALFKSQIEFTKNVLTSLMTSMKLKLNMSLSSGLESFYLLNSLSFIKILMTILNISILLVLFMILMLIA